MSLSNDLITKFVRATKNPKDTKSETTAYGTIVESDGLKYVRFDGSELLTPVSSTSDARDGDRVTVMIKNHTATVTGNLSSPSARTTEVQIVTEEVIKFDTVLAEKATIKQLEVEQGRIDKLEADDAVIKGTLTAHSADIQTLTTDKLDADTAEITYATIENLDATNADVTNLTAEVGEFKVLSGDKFTAIEANIDDLSANKLDAVDADIIKADITDLNAEVANIDTLIFGSATGTTIQTSFSNAVIAQLGDAQIKSAMIESISADKITAGDIITNNVRVKSEDGSLLISDETMQISDETRVRVQIGKDASGDYSINIWDADGNLMFSKGGITDSAIKDAIIRNDMVSDTANIAAHKLDIDSLFEEINGSSNSIKSTQIYLDDAAQTLDVAFKELETNVTELGTTVSSQGTQITTIQGQISSKVWQQDIDAATNEMSTQYSTLEQEVDGISVTVASHTSQINNKADSSAVTSVSNRVTSIEANLNGFQSTVSSTYATKTEVTGIEVGGRNLLLNTAGDELVAIHNGGNAAVSTTNTSFSNSSGITTLTYSSSNQEIYYRFMTPTESMTNMYGLELNKSYTLSGKAQVITESGAIEQLAVRVQNYKASSGWYADSRVTITTTDTTDWVDFSATFKMDEAATGCYISIQLWYTGSWTGTIKLKHLQLEKGTLATAWSPAPEDYPTVDSVAAAQNSANVAQSDIDNLRVGARNLLRNTKTLTGSNVVVNAAIADETYKGFIVRTKDLSDATEGSADMVNFQSIYPETLGEEYTLSFYAKGSGRLVTYFYGPSGYVPAVKFAQSTGATGTTHDGSTSWTLSDTWTRYWVTWTLGDTGDLSLGKWVLFRVYFGSVASICGMKLEKGNRATDWTPAPEDVDVDIATAQAAAEAAQATANQNAVDMANIVTDFNSDISNLQTQIDGSIMTWFYEVEPTDSNEPALNWATTDLKNIHLGDLYYDTITGYCYRYQVKNNVYSWQRITDTDVTKALADAKTAQDTADQKRRVFYTQPSPPYDTGDLWVQGSGGDILRCQTAKVSGQSYTSSDWIAASKYTDDTVANTANNNALAAQSAASNAQSDIDNLVIGGRNLLRNSKGNDVTDWVYGNVAVVEDNVKGYCVERQVTTASESYIGSTRTGIVDQSTKYTFSADVWCNEYLVNFDLFWLSDTYDDPKTGQSYTNVISNSGRSITPNKWTRISWTFTTKSNDRTGYIRFDNNGTTEEGTASILRVANLKLEKGTRATDWTPAPEDLESRVTTAETKILQNENSITSLATRTSTVENKFSGYSTTEEMNSAITQSANNITSSVSETYTTKTEFNNLEVGGRNLIAGTSRWTEYVGKRIGTATFKDVWGGTTITAPTGSEYVVSFDAKGDVEQTITCYFYSPNTTLTAVSSTGQSRTGIADGSCQVTITTEWARYWVKWTQTAATTVKSVIVGRNHGENDIYIRGVKFEAGSVPSDWSPAPEDMDARVSTAESKITQNTSDITSVVSRTADNETAITSLQQTADGLTLRIGTAETNISTAQSTANTAQTTANNAAKTATNYISASGSGLVVGDMTASTLANNVLIDTDSVDIRTGSTVMATFGAKLIELGRNTINAIIKLCGGKGQIEYSTDEDTGDDYLQMSADKLRLKSGEMSSLYSTYTDESTRWEKSATNVTPTSVDIYATECIDPAAIDNVTSWNTSRVTVNPDSVEVSSADDVNINATGSINLHGSSVNDDYGSILSVIEGSSGIWTYRKWSNGELEMWGTYTVSNLACTTTLGGLYRTAVFSPSSFPFTVYNPRLVANYESDGYGAMLWATTQTTTSKPPSYYLIRPTSATIASGEINFHVVGKWTS